MSSIINGNDSPSFYVTPTGITIGGRTKEYPNIAAMLADTNPGRYAKVEDATGDPTVKSGSAIYKRIGTDWKKVYEEEVMDADINISWSTLAGAPNVTAAQVETAVSNSHTHSNSTVLNELGVDSSGKLTLNGSVVCDGNGGAASSGVDITHFIITRPSVDIPVFLRLYTSETGSTSDLVLVVDTLTSTGREKCKVHELSAGSSSWVDFPSNGLTVDYADSPVAIDLSNIQGIPGYIFYRWVDSNGSSDREYKSTYFPCISEITPEYHESDSYIDIDAEYYPGLTVQEAIQQIGSEIGSIGSELEEI